MKREKFNTDVAGIDISKRWLDVRFAHSEDHLRFENKVEAFGELLTCLRDHGVRRVGMEASGDYEWAIRQALEQAGFEVVCHQPQDIKAFGRFRRIKAKSDKKDARLIAQATENWEGVIARRDPDLIDLAEMMTYYDHVTDLLAQSKNAAEHHHLKDIRARNSSLIAYLKAEKLSILKAILKRIRARPDLNERFELLKTMPGAGPVVAAGLVIRMPELGTMEHGKAAALVGVAPYDHDSGSRSGKRFISGGRDKPRALVYIAALAAKRVEPALKAFAERLKGAGKPPKVVLVAVMRKFIEAANLVLKRKTPWLKLPA
jgi:transposase